MASWSDFAGAAPALAEQIRSAIHQYGAGLGYLATVRRDGGPRIHPVSPAIVSGGFYCCLLDTPKRRDLERDARYALHAYPSDDSDDEAGVRGRARLITEPSLIRRIATQLRAETRVDWWLYELRIDEAFVVRRGNVATDDVAIERWVDPFRPRALSRPRARAC
jgi:Pyridoxamine 5'-phosphate oxidase